MTRSKLPALLAALFLPACTVGGTLTSPGGEDGPDGEDLGPGVSGADAGAVDPTTPDAEPEPVDYAMLLSPTSADLNLGERSEFTITLSSDNFAGPVTLSALGAPESWLVEFSPSEVIELPLDGTVDVQVSVEVPADGEIGSHTLSFAADAEPGLRENDATVSVENLLLMPIADGTGGGQHVWRTDLVIRAGTVVRFVNQDTETSHRIHAGDGQAGFPHQDGEMNPAPSAGADGGIYEITITEAGSYDYYCHNHDPGSGVGLIGVANP